MDQQIVFTPIDVVHMVSTITALIISVNAAALVLISWYKRAHAPEEKQNERIADIEEKVTRLERGLQRMREDFEESQELIRALEKDNHDFRRVVVKGLRALTEHAINGDGSEYLHKSQEAINDYLLKSKEEA